MKGLQVNTRGGTIRGSESWNSLILGIQTAGKPRDLDGERTNAVCPSNICDISVEGERMDHSRAVLGRNTLHPPLIYPPPASRVSPLNTAGGNKLLVSMETTPTQPAVEATQMCSWCRPPPQCVFTHPAIIHLPPVCSPWLFKLGHIWSELVTWPGSYWKKKLDF